MYHRSVNSTEIGNRTEGVILAALLRAGRRVLLPFGGGGRYDLALDDGGQLVRVQCKTAVYQQGCVVFNTNSHKRDHTRMGYRGDADLFGVWCPALDKIYLVPVKDVNEREGRLRVDPSRNNQARRVRWAQQYELISGALTQLG